jgi:hypothetical protein
VSPHTTDESINGDAEITPRQQVPRRCPSRVNRITLTVGRRLSVYSDERTFARSAGMSQGAKAGHLNYLALRYSLEPKTD